MRFRLFMFYTMILIRSVLTGGVLGVIWYYGSYLTGLHLPGNESVSTDSGIPSVFMLHGLVAAALIPTIISEYSNVQEAVEKNDREMFEHWSRKRIPFMAKFWLVTMSAAVMVAFMVLDYQHPATGWFWIWFNGFVLAFFWEGLSTLDSPARWAPFVQAVDESWLKGKHLPWKFILLGYIVRNGNK